MDVVVARAANAIAVDRMLEGLGSPRLELADPGLGMRSRRGCKEHSLEAVEEQMRSRGTVCSPPECTWLLSQRVTEAGIHNRDVLAMGQWLEEEEEHSREGRRACTRM